MVGCAIGDAAEGDDVGDVVGLELTGDAVSASKIADEVPVICASVAVYEIALFVCVHAALPDPPPLSPPLGASPSAQYT